MTEITQWQQPGALTAAPAATFVPDYQSRAVARLGEWVASADAAYNVASRLVESSFVPAQFKGKPIEATAAILAGSEVGLSPMAALRSFDIIQGQAAPRAITLRAIVQSFGHEIVMDDSTSSRCIMRGKRRGSSEWQRSVWTIDRAKDLGLTGKDGWKKQPTAMLVARATSEIARLIASDAILGIGYTSEELNDGATGDPLDVAEAPAEQAPAQPATRRMSRKAPAPVEQPADDNTEDAEVVTEPATPLTKRTQGRIFAQLEELWPGADDDQQRALFAWALGVESLASRKDITEEMGQRIEARFSAEKDRREAAAAQTGGE